MSDLCIGFLYGLCSGIVIVITAALILTRRDRKTGRIDIPDIKKDSNGDLWVVTEHHDGFTCMVKLVPEDIEDLRGDMNEEAIRHN